MQNKHEVNFIKKDNKKTPSAVREVAFIDLTLSAFIVLYSSLYYRDLPLVAREEIDDATGTLQQIPRTT